MRVGRTLMDENSQGMGLRPTGTEAGATSERELNLGSLIGNSEQADQVSGCPNHPC